MQATFCPYCLKLVTTDTCPYCGSNVHYTGNPMHLPVGTTLNGAHPYVLGACRGQGGFGVTYIALDAMTNARVAVKEYFPTYCSGRTSGMTIQSYYGQEDSYEKGRERFLDEARMLQSLSDLNSVVNVADFFETNNTAYLVMEFLDGCSLKDYVLQNGKMPAKQFLEQLKNLMADIDAMHQRGVIHRDIAPDNIMLLQDGTLKLIDFGAARSYLGEQSMSVVVKKGFAPVEQHLRTGLTGATDVYALAASIYFCITGIVPPDSAERLYGNGDMQSPISLGADITPAQEAALAHALEVQPKNRTQSAAQFMGELFGQIPVEEPVVTDEKTEEEKDPVTFVTEDDPNKKPKEEKEEKVEPSDPKPAPSKGNKKTLIGIAAAAAAIAVLVLLLTVPKMTAYNQACDQLESGFYLEASNAFKELGEYKDSHSRYLRAQYLYGKQLMEEENYLTAAPLFRDLGNYSDSAKLKQESFYLYAVQLMEANRFDEAIHYFDSLGDYFDSAEMILECKYRGAFQSLEEGDNDNVIAVIQELTKHKFMTDKINELKYQFVVGYSGRTHDEMRFDVMNGRYLGTYFASEDAEKVYDYLSSLADQDYKNSKDLYHEIYGWKATVKNFSDKASREANANKYNSYLGQAPDRVLKEISVRKVEDFNFKFLITGGAPGETVDLYAEYIWPDGSSGEWQLNWNDRDHNSYAEAGWSSTVNFVRAGKLTVRVCIRGTGECIGERTMIVK